MILLRVTNKFIDLPFIALSDLKITPKIVISAGGNELLNKCNEVRQCFYVLLYVF